jgi:hypothetical protein
MIDMRTATHRANRGTAMPPRIERTDWRALVF